IRLGEEDDSPFFAQQGFSRELSNTENTWVEPVAGGAVCRDTDGKVSLECTCGMVISGKTDTPNSLLTPGGSIWTNDFATLLEIPRRKDPRRNPRKECIHQGYASVALVPIRTQDRNVGLIHLGSRRKGCFSPELVERLEAIASHIGAAWMRKLAEEALRRSEKKFRSLFESMDEGFAHCEMLY